MAYPILGTPVPQFLDSSGDPYVGGTITTQNPTNDAVKASYPTAADADASTNGTSGDITLDAEGKPTATQYWGRNSEDYKVIIKDSSGAVVDTMTSIRMPEGTRVTLQSFAEADTTPSVADGTVFLTWNGNVTITGFDDGGEAQVIHLISDAEGGTATTLSQSSALQLRDQLDWAMIDNDTITLVSTTGANWFEVGRKEYNRFVTLAAAKTLVEGDSGRTYYLNIAGGFTVTLPAPANGAKFKFIVKTAPTTAYIIATNSSANIIYGTISDTTATVAANAEDTINFVASTALIGDSVELTSDGTNWYMTAQSQANGGITVAAT